MSVRVKSWRSQVSPIVSIVEIGSRKTLSSTVEQEIVSVTVIPPIIAQILTHDNGDVCTSISSPAIVCQVINE